MNNRFGSDRSRSGEFGPSRRGERSGWQNSEDDERSAWGREGEQSGWDEERGYRGQSREPQYSSGQGSYGQRDESRPGWYSRGRAGTYDAGSGGGYQGGHGGGGYGGSTGTDYSGGRYGGQSAFSGSQAGYGGTQGGYGGNQGYGYGTGGDSSRRSFGSGYDQGFRGRDVGSPGSDLRSTQRGGFAGRGPKGYTRGDERIREDVCERLSADDDVDATEIEVRVQNGEVTLAGSVETRSMKRQAEDLAEEVSGVKDVHNNLRVLKGFLNEIKDKVTGEQDQGHYANTGTKNAPSGSTAANGRA